MFISFASLFLFLLAFLLDVEVGFILSFRRCKLMASHAREELEDKLIQLDLEIKDRIAKIKVQETYLRVHDMDQEEIEMERNLTRLRGEGHLLERISQEEKTAIKKKRLVIVQSIDILNNELKQLIEEKQAVEETLLNDFLEMCDRLIRTAPQTCVVSDTSRGVLEQHLNTLGEVRLALQQGLENKFALHPMRYKSHNFYYLLQQEEDGMDINGLRAVCVRHCDVPLQHKLMVCVGRITQEPNRVVMSDSDALVVSDLGDFSFHGPVDGRGQRHGGKGYCVYADGLVYEGEFSKNKREGHGTAFFPNGEMYVGEFHQDKVEQQGTWHYLSGDRYEGEFRNGCRTGFGVMYFADGNIYEGEWKNDKPEGHGKAKYTDGLEYVGEFKNGGREGKGVLSNGQGGYYEGDWKADEKNGTGFVHFPNDLRYDGKWKDGIRRGPTNAFTAAPPPAEKVEESDQPFAEIADW